MDDKEAERREFEIGLEKVRLFHNFTKDALLISFFMFYIGGLVLMFKDFKITVLMVFLVGIFVVFVGLVAVPRLLVYELDKLKPKK